MRLLLAEDDELFGSATHKSLLRFGYVVDWTRSGKEVIALLQTYEFTCVLLDIGLPEVRGDNLLRSIRERGIKVAVIVVTARGGAADRVNMLDIGADDYMVKPIDLNELSARLRAVVRRTQPKASDQIGTDHSLLRLFPESRTATWSGKLVPLTNREFWLLETLERRKNEVLSRAQLEEALYGWGEEVESNAVEVHIHHLRQKFAPTLIQTVRGVGYQFGLR